MSEEENKARESSQEPNRLYTPQEAVEYLEKERGMHITVTALRMRRNRNKAKAERVLNRISLWEKKELDALPAPRKSPRPKDLEEELSQKGA